MHIIFEILIGGNFLTTKSGTQNLNSKNKNTTSNAEGNETTKNTKRDAERNANNDSQNLYDNTRNYVSGDSSRSSSSHTFHGNTSDESE